MLAELLPVLIYSGHSLSTCQSSQFHQLIHRELVLVEQVLVDLDRLRLPKLCIP